MNCVILNGRLAADPESGEGGKGVAYARFPLALERRSGQEKRISYLDCVAFKQTGEFARKFLHKGDSIIAVGSINIREWSDSSGMRRKAFEVVVNQITFPASGRGRSGNGQQAGMQQGSRNGETPAAVGAAEYEGYY